MKWGNLGLVGELHLPVASGELTWAIGIPHLSNVQHPYDIPLYWVVDRDPYNGLLQSSYNWVVESPISNNQPGFWTLLIWKLTARTWNTGERDPGRCFMLVFGECTSSKGTLFCCHISLLEGNWQREIQVVTGTGRVGASQQITPLEIELS